jgi:fructose-bisphosphate aldolase, class II
VARVTTAEIVTRARGAGLAAIAFNVIGLEQAEAVASGAEAAGTAVLLQVSENAVRFRRGGIGPLGAALVEMADAATVPIGLHLDHATTIELCRAAVEAGFSSVMFDAAERPYGENVAAMREVVEWAHAADVWVEAELGEIGGKEGARDGELTDPAQAASFVDETGVDLLGVAVGSRHKMLGATARLDLGRVAELRRAVSVPLVLHGSSGVADDHLRAAVDAGIVKINVGTRLAQRFTEAVRERLEADSALVDPRPYLADARAAMAVEAEAMLTILAR